MLRGRFLVLIALLALPLSGLAQDDPKKDTPRSEDKVRLELRDAPLAAVLKSLCERGGRTLVLREEVPERVSLSFSEMSAEDAFDQLLALHGYRKELEGNSTIVTRRVPDVAPVASSDDPVGRLYLLVRVPGADAAAALSSVTDGKAVVDVLPGDHELLVVARPSVHEAVKAWLADADAARPDARTFVLLHRTIAGVDSAAAATSDPIAREVGRLLSPIGALEVDLAKNAILVRDEAPALERVARRLAVLDRAPLPVTIEVAALQVEPGTPLPGFAPANDLPAAFASESNGGVMACFASESQPLDAIVVAFTDNPDELDIAALRGRTKERCDERKTVTLELAGMPAGIAITPRIASGGIELEVRGGTTETRIRAPSGRPVAIRGLVKTDRWTGGWSPERSELVLVIVATADLASPPRPPRETPSAPRDKTPELALPDDWVKSSAPK